MLKRIISFFFKLFNIQKNEIEEIQGAQKKRIFEVEPKFLGNKIEIDSFYIPKNFNF